MDAIVDPRDLELDAVSQAEMDEDRTAKANLRILREYAVRSGRPDPRRILLRFLASPVEIIGTDGRITALKVERNELVVDANGALRSRGIGQFETIETGLVPDSAATVEAMLADLPLLQRLGDGHRNPSAIEALLRERGVDYVTYPDWQVLDAHELAAGRAEGRPRRKVTTVPEMMAIIRQGR